MLKRELNPILILIYLSIYLSIGDVDDVSQPAAVRAGPRQTDAVLKYDVVGGVFTQYGVNLTGRASAIHLIQLCTRITAIGCS